MYHHVAIAAKDIEKSHRFYTEAMGFKLVKVVKRQAFGGEPAGWTKHIFYDTGDGSLFALWDLHLTAVGDDWRAGFSRGMGLPLWINHIAFEVETLGQLEEKKRIWLDYGLRVTEVDHDFIRSIYTIDPDKTMVEWTVKTRVLTAEDHREADELLADNSPALIPDYEGEVFEPTAAPA